MFAGVLPAGAIGLVIGALIAVRSGDACQQRRCSPLVWLTVTITGYRAGRQYRIADHRRWMIRSVVLTLSIITNRVWAVVWVIALVAAARRRRSAATKR